MSATALLVFARSAGFVFRAPGFSHPSVPGTVRAGFALALALVLLPGTAAVHLRGAALAGAVACDFCIGAAIGLAASILYDGAYAGGRALDDYAGIRGSVPNAQFFAASGFGRIWSTLFTAGFFLLGGYRIAMAAFAQSFAKIPPGSLVSAHDWAIFAVRLPAGIIEAALLIAGPAMAAGFVAQLALGSLTRVIPRFASFTLSFPVVFGLVLLMTAAAAPVLFRLAARPWITVPFAGLR